MPFLLLGIYLVFSFFNEACLKKSSNVLRGGTTDQPVYILITAAIACFFFAAMNGFSIRVNPVTWLYAVAFSVIVLAALLLSLIIYRYASMPTVSVIRSTLTLLATSVLGSFLFSETVSPLTALRIALLMIASVLIYFSQHKAAPVVSSGEEEGGSRGGGKWVFPVLMALLVLDVCATNLLTKSFSIRVDVSDANSYYFATNAVLFGMGAVWLLLVGRGKGKEIVRGLRQLSPKNYAVIVLQTVSSNVVSLVSIPLNAMLPVASFSAFTSAIGVVAATIASLCFREKQNTYSAAAIVVAVLSFLIGAF